MAYSLPQSQGFETLDKVQGLLVGMENFPPISRSEERNFLCSLLFLFPFQPFIFLSLIMIRIFFQRIIIRIFSFGWVMSLSNHALCLVLLNYFKVHKDDFRLNVILQLFVLIAKQPAFYQLRTVEQLGYITFLSRRFAAWLLQVMLNVIQVF